MKETKFAFAEKSKELEVLKRKVFKTLDGNDQYRSLITRINEDLKLKENEDKLKITFIGQYNSGKSTIISAMTGNEGIKIDSDISTDCTTSYNWRDVLVVDSPGLYTHHPEHDEITQEAIKQADIVVYCLTYSLFDPLLLHDFNNLAYERGYAGKIFIVVNKMNGEFGNYNDLRTNYIKSLKESLGEELKKYPISFIIAQWQRDNNPVVRAESHFDEFIDHLNDFIEKNGMMAKLLSPANIIIDNLQQGIVENNEDENREFFQIIDRIERSFKRQERECDSFFRSLKDELHSAIVNAGYRFSNMEPQSQIEAEENSRKIESEIENQCNIASCQLEDKLTSIQEDLNTSLEEVAKSELVQNFYAEQIQVGKLGKNAMQKDLGKDNAETLDKLIGGVANNFAKGASTVANRVVEMAGAEAVQGTVKAGQVANSALHTTVYNVGKFFGHSFKPWGAANAAKGLANLSKALGPILAIAGVVFGFAMEIIDGVKEHNQEEKKREYKRSVVSSFIEQADSVIQQFKKQFDEYKKNEIYGKLKYISDLRNDRINGIKKLDNTAKELKTCIDDLKKLINKTK
jgi:GTPase Era involved in 16S rRNA processing